MLKKKTYDEYIEELKKRQSNVEPLEEYAGTDTPILHRCKICGYRWPLRPARALCGNVCPNCSGKIRRTHEEYISQLAQIQPNIEVCEEYVSRHTKILHRCKLDGYEWRPTPGYFFMGGNCPVCVGKKIGPAPEYKNSIWASNCKEIFSRFMTEEQMKTTMPNSGKKIVMKCPDCGRPKSISPNNVYRTHSIGCICSDGISYPNKFIYSLLNQLNVDYIPEHIFAWSNKKRYDIYIPSLKCIIENHGPQHYDNCFKNIDSRTLDEEQENDKNKQEMALKNGIQKYIIIDCRKSNIDWIKNNVLNSMMSDIFDLSSINWTQCHSFACSNFVNIASDLWNDGIGVYSIAKEMHISATTVVKYLKQANQCGLCDYTKENSYKRMGESNQGGNSPIARITVQLDNNFKVIKLWRCITEVETVLNINMKNVSRCCYGDTRYAGGYQWRFLYDVTKRNGTIIPGAITLGLITEEEALAQLNTKQND